ncbi:6,7-dimethyl-8-ribityllumazine synthase [Lentisphaerota bacterium ZTH]|nr:6,7-dimethyl-8-ribityllumazine synthase [Lentisphaerota bacterium]WET06254.1 6,7-dimethyl-8-ribityllumazine synthase [Lentisphaerota bacterium ZTH]
MNRNVKNIFEGTIEAKDLKIGIVCSRFNEFFVSKLLDGAIDAVVRHGGEAENVEVAWVPGAYELPFAVKKLVDLDRFDAVVALGVVIQGATPHAGYINAEVSKALALIGLESGTPVGYGLVTADNIEQAIERSGTKAGNKGADAALAAIEMANLNKKIK